MLNHIKQNNKFNFNSLIENYSANESDKLVIYTGAFGHVNDVKFLINVANEIKKINENIKFIIALGIQKQNIYSIAKKLNLLNDSVFILQPIEKSKIPYLYSKASITTSLFINHRVLWNNSANKFFDGLAAGKPVMINYSGGKEKF